MYIPQHFHETSPERIREIADTAPLACIVAHTAEGLLANHIPLLQAPDGSLIGHIARAYGMHRLIAEGQDVLAIFRGPDAYISPNFYPTKAQHHCHVPTWNYQVVHVYGHISFQHDEQAKRAAVGLLTRAQERKLNGEKAWRMADAPLDYMQAMLESIVAFRISATRTLAKSKLCQNDEDNDFFGVIAGLQSTGHDTMARRMECRSGKSEQNP